jgi:preprotein translocase subunit SecB
VRELKIAAHQPPEPDLDYELEEYPLRVAHSEYDPEDRTIGVYVRMELGSADSDTSPLPFHVIVDIVANFQVDDAVFPIEFIDQWASGNAPIILFPYLREHVFALTARAGFRPAILPLVEVPTVRVQSVTAPPVDETGASTEPTEPNHDPE